jgi:hypothetical protein
MKKIAKLSFTFVHPKSLNFRIYYWSYKEKYSIGQILRVITIGQIKSKEFNSDLNKNLTIQYS